MARFLPFSFLVLVGSLFGLSWIITQIDPETASWYIFGAVVFLIFLFLLNFLGLILYFVRTKFYRTYSANWYAKTSFKMAFFVAAFIALVSILAILQLVSTLNVALAILAVTLFAFWSYLGIKK